MNLIYFITAILVLISMCLYIGKNFAELAKIINKGQKTSEEEKKGLKFLQSKKCLYSYISISTLFGLAAFIIFPTVLGKFIFSAITMLLIACFIMDIKMKLLPDFFTVSILWLALIGSALGVTGVTPSHAIIASATLYVSFFILEDLGSLLAKRVVIGGGDIKILASYGALFGLKETIVVLFYSCVLMLLFLVGSKMAGKKLDREIPFGIGLTTVALINIFYPIAVNRLMEYLLI